MKLIKAVYYLTYPIRFAVISILAGLALLLGNPVEDVREDFVQMMVQ